MKKITIAASLIFTFVQLKAQDPWTTSLMSPTSNTADIGTLNDKPFNIFTNNQKRLTIEADGKLKFNHYTGRGKQLLYIDNDGNIITNNPQDAVLPPYTPDPNVIKLRI